MARLRVSIVFGSKPNFDEGAFKYFILSINKIQTTYEFCFPYLEGHPFNEKICTYKTANDTFNLFIKSKKIIADYYIAINTISFDNNFFFKDDNNTAVITTDTWEKYFSPPSVFEYLMHCIFCCLLYSQIIPKEREMTSEMFKVNIDSHYETIGCIADFTLNKNDDKVDILVGYICEKHQAEIVKLFGQKYLDEITTVIDRKWIGSIDEKDSVAYNLQHAFKFNINKDSGFNKNFWDKCQDKFYEVPGNFVSETLKFIITVILTYLFVKYGIMHDATSK